MSDEALYQPDRDARADLCDALRLAGLIGPGPRIELRLAAALTRMGPLPREALYHVLHAICRASPEREAFDRVLVPWLDAQVPILPRLPPSAVAHDPEPPRTEATSSAGLGLLVAFIVAGLGTVVLVVGPMVGPDGSSDQPLVFAREGEAVLAPEAIAVDASPSGGPVAPDRRADPPISAPVGGGETGSDDEAPLRPTLGSRVRQAADSSLPQRIVAALLLWLLAVLAAIYAVRRRRERRAAPVSAPPASGRPARPLPRRRRRRVAVLGDVAARLASSGHLTLATGGPLRIDIDASVRATAARFGRIPVLRFRSTPRPQPIQIWVDRWATHDTPTLARAVDELGQALARTGIEHTVLDFAGVPLWLAEGRRRVPLEGLPADPADTLVAILTDGAALLRTHGRRRRRLLQQLAAWPELAVFVLGSHAPEAVRAWAEGALAVHPGAGVVDWLCHRQTPPTGTLDGRQMRTWSAACALTPHLVSTEDALDLRDTLGLDAIPDAALSTLEASGRGAGLGWSPSERAALIRWLRATDREGFDRALGWWKARYGAAAEGRPSTDPLRFGQAMLDLWTASPDTLGAVAGRLFDAGVPAGRPLAFLAPSDIARENPRATHLPWRWRDVHDFETRERLRAVGLGEGLGGVGHADAAPDRRWWVPAFASALAAAAGCLVLALPPPRRVHVVPCIDRAAAADGRLATVWRCGTRLAERPRHGSWPARSAVSLYADPADVEPARLALALLDAGGADAVWWDAPAPPAEQRIAVVFDRRVCPGDASACVRSADASTLTAALGATVRPLRDVWPGVERGGGWMLGEDASPEPDGAVAPPPELDATLAADASTAGPAVASLRDAGAMPSDAGRLPIRLTGITVGAPGDDPLEIRVEYRGPRRPEASIRRTGRQIVLTVEQAVWQTERALEVRNDPDVRGLTLRNPGEIVVALHRVNRPPPAEIGWTSRALVLRLGRRRPPADAGDGRPTDASMRPSDAGPGLDDGPPASPCAGTSPRAAGPCRSALVLWSGGRFDIDDDPATPPVLIEPHWLAQTEVSNAQWAEVMPDVNLRDGTRPDHPARHMSWYQAVSFCNRLSALEGFEPVYDIDGSRVRQRPGANGYRLPTEAEWLRVARAVARDIGEDLDAGAVSATDGRVYPQSVRFGEARLRMYGMLGNVREWMWDPVGQGERVRAVRGSSFRRDASRLDPRIRTTHAADQTARDIGFRIARDGREE